MAETRIQNIILRMTSIIEGENWLGETFRNKIDTLTGEMAFHQPMPHIHSVAELISHLTVWKEANIGKLQGVASELNMNSPENWKDNELLQEEGWDNLKTRFYGATHQLVALLYSKSDAFLEETAQADSRSNGAILEGLIQHDVYHLGQIGITLKLSRVRNYRRFLN